MKLTRNQTSDRPEDGRSAESRAEGMIRQNVRAIAELETVARQPKTRTDRIVDAIARVCGSLAFLSLHVLLFGLWIAFNVSPFFGRHFDPFPFSILAVAVSLEAILLATCILIIQNRQSQLVDRRSQLDLQINIIAEQEITKMLHMLEAMQKRMGIAEEDTELEALKQATQPEKLAEEIERRVEETSQEGEPAGSAEPHQDADPQDAAFGEGA